jgi:hypothetical protein
MVKKYFPFLLLLFSSCFLFEDKDNQNTNLTLSLHSAGVTTVNLNISPEDSLAEFTFELTRDDSTVQILSLQSDTIIKDTGLNPNTSYTYKGYWKNGTERIGESETLTVTTMDTTSHNFTWEIITLGNGGTLRDVWIIDENDIWVVGDIITDSMEYNAAHWDGNEWELIGIYINTLELKSIHYFNENDIWISSGLPKHWNGEKWVSYHLWDMGILDENDGSVSTIWGTSSNNMYFVGNKGTIVHYDGNEFVKMYSPKAHTINGIAGTVNSETGDTQIWAWGWSEYPYRGFLLQSNGINWEIVWDEFDPFFEDEACATPTIWANEEYFVSYTGCNWVSQISIHDVHELTNYEIIHIDSVGYIRDIAGQQINDLFFVGNFGNVMHFNGKTFKYFPELNLGRKWWGVDYINDFVVMVNIGGKIAIGQRQ